MIQMLIYGFGVMFSPGPVTILTVNQGINGKFRQTVGFCFGVGVASYSLFILYGFTGEKIIKKEYLTYLSILGASYIVYLAYKIFTHKVQTNITQTNSSVSFRDGFIMQFINPKASLAALPVATISYQNLGITGFEIIVFSLVFLLYGFISPLLYCLLGQYCSRFITNHRILNAFNKVMACLLFYVGLSLLPI